LTERRNRRRQEISETNCRRADENDLTGKDLGCDQAIQNTGIRHALHAARWADEFDATRVLTQQLMALFRTARGTRFGKKLRG